MSARAYRLGVMLGDGIGPEIVPSSVRVVDAALAAAGADPVVWHELPLGASAIEEHGSALPAATTAALADLDGWLLGPHDSAAYPEPFRSQLNPSGPSASTSTCTRTSGRRVPSRAGRRSPRTPTW